MIKTLEARTGNFCARDGKKSGIRSYPWGGENKIGLNSLNKLRIMILNWGDFKP